MTRELLSEVLSKEVEDFERSMNNLVISIKGDGIRTVVNIHELAHLCKEWAYDNGYTVITIKVLDGTYEVYVFKSHSIYAIFNELDACYGWFDIKEKPEAIFKACEWILEQKEIEL